MERTERGKHGKPRSRLSTPPTLLENPFWITITGIYISGKSPAGTVLPSYKLRCLRTVLRKQVVSVPLDLVARAQGHAAQQHGFREARGDVKTRVADLRLVFLDGNKPFLRVGKNITSGFF